MNHVKEQIHCKDAYTIGLTGRGVGVAVLDTGAGVRKMHVLRGTNRCSVFIHRTLCIWNRMR